MGEILEGMEIREEKSMIHIDFVSEMRYDTIGDWRFLGDDLVIEVFDLKNEKYNLLIVVHELVEAMLCKFAGVTTEQVDKWDMNFKGEGEPGDDPRAPYHCQHWTAMVVEQVLAGIMGVDWSEYNDFIESLEVPCR